MNKQDNSFEANLYSNWSLEPIEIPPRSKLFPLAPLNIGTSDAESLASYISRLSQEYLVSPVLLLKYGLIDKTNLPKNLIKTDSMKFPKSINGMGQITENLVFALQQATLRNDIYLTTLLPLKGILSQNNLFKAKRAWCSLCFSEQVNSIGFNYEKLLWSLESVKKCRKHQIPLEDKCTNCDCFLHVFSGRFRPGYCSVCFRWLGNTNCYYQYEKEEGRDVNRQDTIEEQFEKILDKTAFLEEGDGTRQFIQNLAEIIKQVSFGNINEFSHQVKIWHNNIRLLLKGKMLPTWDTLYRISVAIEVPILDILITPKIEVSKKNPEYENAVAQIKRNINQLSSLLDEKDEIIKKILEIYYFEYPPPSAKEITRRFDYKSSDHLKRKYPELYKKIVAKHSKYIEGKKITMSDEDVEEVLTQASTQNPPPSLQSIFRKIDCHNTGYRYYSKFPLLCSTIATRYKNFRSQTSNLERIESLLIAALNETPPPSISELARRIKCKRGTLDGLFPELVSKIINQRKGFLISSSEMSSSEKKIQKIAKEVEEYDYFITEKNEMNFLRKLYLHSLKSLIEE